MPPRNVGEAEAEATRTRGEANLKTTELVTSIIRNTKKDFNQCDKNLVHLKLSKKHFTSGIYN